MRTSHNCFVTDLSYLKDKTGRIITPKVRIGIVGGLWGWPGPPYPAWNGTDPLFPGYGQGNRIQQQLAPLLLVGRRCSAPAELGSTGRHLARPKDVREGSRAIKATLTATSMGATPAERIRDSTLQAGRGTGTSRTAASALTSTTARSIWEPRPQINTRPRLLTTPQLTILPTHSGTATTLILSQCRIRSWTEHTSTHGKVRGHRRRSQMASQLSVRALLSGRPRYHRLLYGVWLGLGRGAALHPDQRGHLRRDHALGHGPRNQYRADLEAYLGTGKGSHGFIYQLPSSIRNGQTHTIYVRYGGTSTLTSNSPRQISCSLSFFTITPCRVFDSRDIGYRLGANQLLNVPVTGVCGIPANALAIALNSTIISPTVTSGVLNLDAFPMGIASPGTTAATVPNGVTQRRSEFISSASTDYCPYKHRPPLARRVMWLSTSRVTSPINRDVTRTPRQIDI